MPTHPVSKDAARKARQRALQRRGGCMLWVKTGDLNRLVEMLVRREWLMWSESESKEQIALAVGELIDAIAREEFVLPGQTDGGGRGKFRS